MKKKTLLDQISFASLEKMIPCFKPLIRRYRAGEVILSYSGDTDKDPQYVTVLLKGRAALDMLNHEGDAFRLEEYREGDVFGELFTLPLQSSAYIVTAEEDAQVVYIDYQHTVTPCEKICHHHSQLISNLFIMTAQRTQELSFHLSLLSQSSIREKLLQYLRYVRLSEGAAVGEAFTIPMTLTRLAQYLSVDRSAMMREIKALKEAGQLDSDRRCFTLYA